VLEKVGKSGFSGLDFIAGSGADDSVIRDNIRLVGLRNGNYFQSVFQLLYSVVKGEDVGALEHDGNNDEKEKGKECRPKFYHFLTSFLNLGF